MSEIDQQFVEYIIKSIVGNPDKVSIARSVDERGVLLELSVDPEDLGRVIGKRGATAQSLRTLLRALGTKNDARYNLKIIDTGPPPSRPSTDDQSDGASDNTAQDDAASANEPIEDVEVETPAEEAPVDEAADMTSNEESVAEAEPAVREEASSSEVEDDDQTDLASKTRRELAELDDLDV